MTATNLFAFTLTILYTIPSGASIGAKGDAISGRNLLNLVLSYSTTNNNATCAAISQYKKTRSMGAGRLYPRGCSLIFARDPNCGGPYSTPGRRRPPLAQCCVEVAQRCAESDITCVQHARRAPLRPEIAPLEKIGHRDHRRAHGPRFVHPLRPRHVARNPEREAHCVLIARAIGATAHARLLLAAHPSRFAER